MVYEELIEVMGYVAGTINLFIGIFIGLALGRAYGAIAGMKGRTDLMWAEYRAREKGTVGEEPEDEFS